MINKIKDKQTGEVYEIGGSNKLKLVAEGTFLLNGSVYNPIYNFESNKCYLIQIFEGEASYIAVQLWTDGSGRGWAITNDEANMGEIVCIEVHRTFVTVTSLNTSNFLQDYEGYPYKVYELPFALEV